MHRRVNESFQPSQHSQSLAPIKRITYWASVCVPIANFHQAAIFSDTWRRVLRSRVRLVLSLWLRRGVSNDWGNTKTPGHAPR